MCIPPLFYLLLILIPYIILLYHILRNIIHYYISIAIYISETSNICPRRVLNRTCRYGIGLVNTVTQLGHRLYREYNIARLCAWAECTLPSGYNGQQKGTIVMLMDRIHRFGAYSEASFLLSLVDSLCLWVTQMHIDLHIWRFLCYKRRQTKLMTLPLAHACRVKMMCPLPSGMTKPYTYCTDNQFWVNATITNHNLCSPCDHGEKYVK